MAEGSIGKAYIQVLPTTKGIKGKLTEAFKGEGNSAGNTFGSNLVGTVKNLIITAGIGKVLTDSLLAGADLQQSLGGIETLFKDSAATVIENAETAYKRAGMSANQYMETVTGFSASLLQSLGGDTAAAASAADQALVDMSDNANKMGTSMELIQNAYQGFAKSNYTMLDNLKLGYGGTKIEMERLLADATKLSGVEYNIDNLADVYEAIHVIQEDLGIAGATAEEAASTFSGSFASMKAAASDLIAQWSLGTEDISPYLDALGETVFTFVNDNLFPMIGNIFTSLPEVIASGLSMAIQGLNLLESNAETIVQMGIDLVTGIGTAIITAAPYLAESAIGIVAGIGAALINADWMLIGQDTIGQIRDSLDLAAGEILGTDGNIVQSVLDAISINLPLVVESGLSLVGELANGIMAATPDFLLTAGDLMEQLIDCILGMAPQLLSSGFSLIGELALGLLRNLPAITTSIFSILTELLASILLHLPDLLESGISLIGELAAGLIAAIPDLVMSIPKVISEIVKTFTKWDWGDIGKNISKGIAKGISSAAGAIWQAAKDAAKAALQAAKDFLGIKSPARRAADEVGKYIPPGVALGIKNNVKPLQDSLHVMSDVALNTMQDDLRMDNIKPVAATGKPIYGDTVVTIHVYGAQGQDEDELAEIIMQKIQFAIGKKEAAFA